MGLISVTRDFPAQGLQVDFPYPAKIVDNNDPKKMGRVRARIEKLDDDVKDDQLPWVKPRDFPNWQGASNKTGSFSVPKIGSWVSVLFPSKDPYSGWYQGYPVTEETQHPKAKEDYPNNHILWAFDTNSINWYNVSKRTLYYTVNDDWVTEIKQDYKVTVGRDTVVTVKRDQTVITKRDMAIVVDRDGSVTIKGDLNMRVDGKVNATFNDYVTAHVKDDLWVDVEGKAYVRGQSHVTIEAKENLDINAKNINLQASEKIKLRAPAMDTQLDGGGVDSGYTNVPTIMPELEEFPDDNNDPNPEPGPRDDDADHGPNQDPTTGSPARDAANQAINEAVDKAFDKVVNDIAQALADKVAEEAQQVQEDEAEAMEEQFEGMASGGCNATMYEKLKANLGIDAYEILNAIPQDPAAIQMLRDAVKFVLGSARMSKFDLYWNGLVDEAAAVAAKKLAESVVAPIKAAVKAAAKTTVAAQAPTLTKIDNLSRVNGQGTGTRDAVKDAVQTLLADIIDPAALEALKLKLVDSTRASLNGGSLTGTLGPIISGSVGTSMPTIIETTTATFAACSNKAGFEEIIRYAGKQAIEQTVTGALAPSVSALRSDIDDILTGALATTKDDIDARLGDGLTALQTGDLSTGVEERWAAVNDSGGAVKTQVCSSFESGLNDVNENHGSIFDNLKGAVVQHLTGSP